MTAQSPDPGSLHLLAYGSTLRDALALRDALTALRVLAERHRAPAAAS